MTDTHCDGSDLRDERLEWTADNVECVQCGFVWVAVRAVGSDFLALECSHCGAFDSDLHEGDWNDAIVIH